MRLCSGFMLLERNELPRGPTFARGSRSVRRTDLSEVIDFEGLRLNSKSPAARRAGSSPALGTTLFRQGFP
jgi:hypothetical protein